jgi:hypothetical protein
MADKLKVLHIITVDQLRMLRANGWVVIHQQHTDDMAKAFYAGKYPEQVSFTQGFNRMVAQSIREQQHG